MRSPSSAPRVKGLEGSIESTATWRSSFRISAVSTPLRVRSARLCSVFCAIRPSLGTGAEPRIAARAPRAPLLSPQRHAQPALWPPPLALPLAPVLDTRRLALADRRPRLLRQAPAAPDREGSRDPLR